MCHVSRALQRHRSERVRRCVDIVPPCVARRGLRNRNRGPRGRWHRGRRAGDAPSCCVARLRQRRRCQHGVRMKTRVRRNATHPSGSILGHLLLRHVPRAHAHLLRGCRVSARVSQSQPCACVFAGGTRLAQRAVRSPRRRDDLRIARVDASAKAPGVRHANKRSAARRVPCSRPRRLGSAARPRQAVAPRPPRSAASHAARSAGEAAGGAARRKRPRLQTRAARLS